MVDPSTTAAWIRTVRSGHPATDPDGRCQRACRLPAIRAAGCLVQPPMTPISFPNSPSNWACSSSYSSRSHSDERAAEDRGAAIQRVGVTLGTAGWPPVLVYAGAERRGDVKRASNVAWHLSPEEHAQTALRRRRRKGVDWEAADGGQVGRHGSKAHAGCRTVDTRPRRSACNWLALVGIAAHASPCSLLLRKAARDDGSLIVRVRSSIGLRQPRRQDPHELRRGGRAQP